VTTTGMPAHDRQAAAASLADAHGDLAIVSIDHRESLRSMLRRGGIEADDAQLAALKVDAVRSLGRESTAFLLDAELGADAAAALPRDVPLVVAVDRYDQPRDRPILDTFRDEAITRERLEALGATGLKLLAIWRDDGEHARRHDMIAAFVADCRAWGLTSMLEPIVRPPSGTAWSEPARFDEAVIRAAHEYGPHGPDIYKAEAPGYRRGDLSLMAAACRELAEAVAGPWAVLSTGVHPDDFDAVIGEAVRAGADGFVAGRAVWEPSLGEGAAFGGDALRRLTRYRATVRRTREERGA
jgi:sulfofructosephosphate aldolase